MIRLDVPIVSVDHRGEEERRFVESVESFDQKVGLERDFLNCDRN
jgi:hypothetical protein